MFIKELRLIENNQYPSECLREVKMSINNINKFKDKVLRRELCVGTSIIFSDPAISELLGDVGYDFTWIDMEHCPLILIWPCNT